MRATPNSWERGQEANLLRLGHGIPFLPAPPSPRLIGLIQLVVCFLVLAPGLGVAGDDTWQVAYTNRVRLTLARARERFQDDTNSVKAAWELGRALFDFSRITTNNSQQAEIAREGIQVCHHAISINPTSAPARYYLGMHFGQLADTIRNFSALKLVKEMEREFQTAAGLDQNLDYAGPHRSLGLLYFQAPVLISIGSRSKARKHLERAVELAPDYPDNRLNLAEAYLKWGDRVSARRELKAMETLCPEARKTLTGDEWTPEWAEWDSRL